ncbi:MAG: HDIG domain-containing protein [Bacteroides sp.]|nr:HDIG domain-containing protein [Bacteroides sp.]
MVDIDEIFDRFYSDNPQLLATVLTHSQCVAEKALECASRRKIDIDKEFVRSAAMLHDIGVIKCNAPSIFCYGDKPYICHGIEGRAMLDSLGLHRHALVCERHTGSGLSCNDIIRQNLPLPHRDMLPISIEEKLICYADKFFSKSGNLTKEKSLEKVTEQMRSFGEDSIKRFMEIHILFG